MESQTPIDNTNPLFLTAPAFADASMAWHFSVVGGVSALWGRFSWWYSGRKALRDLPDYVPPICFGRNINPESGANSLLLPTLLVICENCPTPVNADNGMDFIRGYAAGCEVITPSPMPHKATKPLWAQNTNNRSLLVGEMSSIEEIEDPYCRSISVTSGGELKASGNTDDLTWSVADLVAAASTLMPLKQGQIISCGMSVKAQSGQPLSGPTASDYCVEIEGLSPLILKS